MDRLQELYNKLKENNISENEKRELFELIETSGEKSLAALAEKYLSQQAPENLESLQADVDSILNKIHTRLESPSNPIVMERRTPWSKVIAIAAAILTVVFFTYRYTSRDAVEEIGPFAQIKDVAPGGKRATLTLADGKTILLDSAKAGQLAIVDGTKITKTDDGQLIYETDYQVTGVVRSNTVSIPRGGEYQLILPDGTKVWLNAQTNIKYPTQFTSAERRVVLTGEAYFEVTKDAKHPFIVETDKQEIKVLGTHFNVNTYNTGKTVTTLAEGSVKVSSSEGSKLLKPGQQSILLNGSLEVESADMESALAWKNGLLFFRDAPLQTVLAEVSRWYDVDVQCNGKPTQELFTGSVSRASNLSAMLRILQLTGVKTKLVAEGNSRKLIIEQ